MGEDNLSSLDKWKNYDVLLEQNQIYVYRRPNTPESIFHKNPNVKIYNAPLMDISSSYIRKAISEGKDVRYLLPETVYQYVMEMHFYENLSK
jgi:nicotinate-nucleotide adenylyltransferase